MNKDAKKTKLQETNNIKNLNILKNIPYIFFVINNILNLVKNSVKKFFYQILGLCVLPTQSYFATPLLHIYAYIYNH